jgi:hypothetical protein
MAVGITKLIRKVFAPTWRYKALKNKPRNVGGLKKRAACRRGKRIDRELAGNVRGKALPETQRIQNWLHANDYKILNTQVLAKKHGLLTYLDLLVSDPQGRRIIIEVKRGCKYKACSNGSLLYQREPGLPNCLFFQHQLQVLISRWLFDETAHVALIYVDDESLEVYYEDDFCAALTPAGKAALVSAGGQRHKNI